MDSMDWTGPILPSPTSSEIGCVFGTDELNEEDLSTDDRNDLSVGELSEEESSFSRTAEELLNGHTSSSTFVTEEVPDRKTGDIDDVQPVQVDLSLVKEEPMTLDEMRLHCKSDENASTSSFRPFSNLEISSSLLRDLPLEPAYNGNPEAVQERQTTSAVDLNNSRMGNGHGRFGTGNKAIYYRIFRTKNVVSCNEESSAAENVAENKKTSGKTSERITSAGKNLKRGKDIKGIVIHEENEESKLGENSNGVLKKAKTSIRCERLPENLLVLVSPIGRGQKVIRLENCEKRIAVVRSIPFLSGTGSVTTVSRPRRSSQSVTSVLPMTVTSPTTATKHQRKWTANAEPSENHVSSDGLPLSSTSSTMLMDNGSVNVKNSTRPGPEHPIKQRHRTMNHLRRMDICNSFDNLKKLVPSLTSRMKTSKVEILTAAKDYINLLKSQETQLVNEMAAVRANNKRLELKANFQFE